MMSKGGVDDAMKVQLQIRQNAEEIADFFSDMKVQPLLFSLPSLLKLCAALPWTATWAAEMGEGNEEEGPESVAQ